MQKVLSCQELRDGHAFMRLFRHREAGARLTLDWCMPSLSATDVLAVRIEDMRTISKHFEDEQK